MKFDKLYGFYSIPSYETYFTQRFQDLQNLGYTLDMIAVDEFNELTSKWGINKFPTMVLSVSNLKGPVLEGGYPSDIIASWLEKNNIQR